jgi:hypothetical protein
MLQSPAIFGPLSSNAIDNTAPGEATVIDAAGVTGTLSVPGADFVLRADYARQGPDLLLEKGNQSVLVQDYFTTDNPPDLATTDGAGIITANLAQRLAGPVAPGQFAQVGPGQFAQASASSGAASIGQVENVSGSAFLTRVDGNRVPAANGTDVFQGDIVETEGGASVGILFSDDTTFALGEDGRMVIDELVFDPEAGTGNATFNVVQGVFSFVSGEISKAGSDAMMVKTPVVTIGIRGTSVAGRAAQEGQANTVTLLADPGGQVGEISVSNAVGTQVLNQPLQTTQVTSAFVPPSPIITLPASAANALYGQARAAMPPPPPPRPERSQNNDDDAAQDGEQAAAEGEGQEGEGEGTQDGESTDADGEQAVDADGQPIEGEGEGEGEGENQVEGDGEQVAAAGGQAGQQDEDGQPLEGDGQPGPGDAEAAADDAEAEAQAAFDQALADGKSMDEAFSAAGQAAGAIGQQGGLNFQPDGQEGPDGQDGPQPFSPFGPGNAFGPGTGNDYFDHGDDDDHFGPDDDFGPDFGPDFGHDFGDGFGDDLFFGDQFFDDFLGDDFGFDPFNDFFFFADEFSDDDFFFFDDDFFFDETTDEFSEILTASVGNDTLIGGSGNTQFEMIQGSTLGGTDTINGGAGTDEISFQNLSDMQMIYDSSTDIITYANASNSVSGQVTLTSIEQVFADDGDESRVRLEFDDHESGFGFILAGTSGNDTLRLDGDGTSAADLTNGSLNFDMDTVTSGLGSIIFAGAGNDTVHGTDLEDDIFGGSGNDTIRGFDESDILNGGGGDDTFIIGSQSELETESGSIAESIVGGSNDSSTGDTIQLGVGSSSGQTFTFNSSSNGSIGVSGIETLNFHDASTTLVANNSFLSGLTNITTESGATSQTLKSSGSSLSLSSVSSVSSDVSVLQATQSGSSGVTITDSSDSVGRTLEGSSFSGDVLSGNGGNDILVGGQGADTLVGGDGDDTFRLDANNDLTTGETLSGGSGSDTIKAGSTSLTIIDLRGSTLSSIEFLDLGSSIGSGLRQTIDIENSTSFDSTIIENFATGTSSTTDIFDWNSTLVAGNGSTTYSTSTDIALEEHTSVVSVSQITSISTTGALEFNFTTAKLGIDFSTASASTIASTVETTMNTSGALVSGGVMSAGAPQTDMLLVFYESGTSGGSTSDAVIMRYQEGGTSEASYSGELSVVGILEGVTDITDTNLA